jgi:hypothetical protein
MANENVERAVCGRRETKIVEIKIRNKLRNFK